MRILDIFKKKKDNKEEQLQDAPKEKLEEIIDKEIQRFFPETGAWTAVAFNRSNELSYLYFPCHLRDYNWLSKLLKKRIAFNQKLNVNLEDIYNYITENNQFQEKKHEYELTIVKWQINHMVRGGDGWVMPKGCDEVDLLISPKVDKIFREGIYLTLTGIGMDSEIVEEGIEKFANLWRERYMRIAFSIKYNPLEFDSFGRVKPSLPEPEKTHKDNWIKLRTYQYYQKHKDSVDKYGIVTPEMNMTKEEAGQLAKIVEQQNQDRLKVIKQLRGESEDVNSSTSKITEEENQRY